MRSNTRVAIIGLGPRGLTVLERIVATMCEEFPSLGLSVHIFEPKGIGHGIHDPEQPVHLLLNTVASQITMFLDGTVCGGGPILPGPSFYEWVNAVRGSGMLSGEEEEFLTLSGISPNGYLPRSVFGHYLKWVFEYLVELKPANVEIALHPEQVMDMVPAGGSRFTIVTESKSAIVADYVFLTTGHSRARPAPHEAGTSEKIARLSLRNPRLRFVPSLYPVHETMASIGSCDTVAIEGAGLAAIDAISELTINRGGRFVPGGAPGRQTYVPGANEPRLIMYSRSGLLLSARAVNQKEVSEQYRARFLTRSAIDSLRAAKFATGGLDFDKDLLPLLLLDMQHAYYAAAVRRQHGVLEAYKFSNRFVVAGAAERERLVAAATAPEDRFCWDKLVDPIPPEAYASYADFKQWLIDFLRLDVASAYEGNLSNPLKAACDVLRDVRDNLRYAIDFAGLSQESHRCFMRNFVPVMNRLAVGPPKARIEELLALVSAGVLEMFLGPSPSLTLDEACAVFRVESTLLRDAPSMPANVLVHGKVPMPSPHEDVSPLMANLLMRGLARPFRNGNFHPGGIEVARTLNVVAKDGAKLNNVWALGTLAEGPKFYTYVVPRPGVNSTALVDAGRCVGAMLADARTRAAGRVLAA